MSNCSAPHKLCSAAYGYGAIRANGSKPAIFSLRSTVWFTDGFGTLDLKEAKALLDELG